MIPLQCGQPGGGSDESSGRQIASANPLPAGTAGLADPGSRGDRRAGAETEVAKPRQARRGRVDALPRTGLDLAFTVLAGLALLGVGTVLRAARLRDGCA